MADYNPLNRFRSRNSNNFLTAATFLVIGAGVGSLAALLLAPQSGKQMRRTLRRKYEDAVDAVEDFGGRAGDIWEKGAEWRDNARERVEPLIRRVRQA
jgi:gas vesicle protein